MLSVIFCLLSVAYPLFHLYSVRAKLSLCYLVLIVSPRRSLNRSIGAGCGYILVASPFCSFFLFLFFLTLCILVELLSRAEYTVFPSVCFPMRGSQKTIVLYNEYKKASMKRGKRKSKHNTGKDSLIYIWKEEQTSNVQAKHSNRTANKQSINNQ